MIGTFVWADGQLSLFAGTHNHPMKLVKGAKASSFCAGEFNIDDHGPDFDSIALEWQVGKCPTDNDLRRMIRLEVDSYGREARYRKRVAATSEDTEPVGKDVGFLRDPRPSLYPPLFRGSEEISPDIIGKLKAHVLNELELELLNPDQFIYFTIYGSGISYNWDEAGDMDIQMWVDIEKYEGEDMTSDDLIATIRRIVQPINFPTFKDLGLESPDDSAEGTMMIQYYPKPGKGTPEENLASKPYACYDLETGEWLEKAKPITPTFYGEHFLMLEPKCQDIALQAEALISELERNILNWQFWYSMYNRFDNEHYRERYEEAQQNAEQEKAGVISLFEGVFGGRAKAYSPEGKGIEDERDMVQKMLEVWGIFQKLKHYAREELPWEETEMPEAAKTSSAQDVLNQGGGTLNVADMTPATHTHGFYVALDGFEEKVPVDQFSDAVLQWYAQGVQTDLVGFWVNDGFVFLDNVQWVESPHEAVLMGKANKQDAVWDIRNQKEIWTKGGGVARQWIQKHADWNDIMEKAQRLRQTGVNVMRNGYENVVGEVPSESRPGMMHYPEIWRSDPQRGTITLWDCTCEWAGFSWGRTRQWKKYEGRPCAHVLALFWESSTLPVEQDDQTQLPTPPEEIPPPGQLTDSLRATVPGQQQQAPVIPGSQPQQPQRAPQPPVSELTTPSEAEDQQLTLPGTFSSWRTAGVLMNGDYVRTNVKVDGEDDRGTYYVVPRNMIGEVIWSDDEETIVIFSIESKALGPHNVRVTAPTENFTLVPREKGTAPRRRR